MNNNISNSGRVPIIPFRLRAKQRAQRGVLWRRYARWLPVVALLAGAIPWLGAQPVAAKAGRITEYPVPTSHAYPEQITVGSDGALWFTEMFGNKIGRITTAGAFTEYAVPTAHCYPEGIASGPDGALWFTEENANKIGRITTAGHITEYPLPTSGSPPPNPWGIAAGPDGALWFTEYFGNKIGRITTAGQITEYRIPIPQSFPQAITTGQDGALWFTASGEIGRLTTTGTFTFSGLQNGTSPGITRGPERALWFVSTYFHANVGRITLNGRITQHDIPTQEGSPQGIAEGRDGALWFTENSAGKIGRMTTSITFTEYNLPSSSMPSGITAGPDGALWFTEESGNKIGRITTG